MDATAADRFDELARHYLTLNGRVSVPTLTRAAAARVERWRGTGVTFRRRADGTVAAACLGVAGVGATEAEALRDLERRLQVAPPGWPASSALR